MMTPEEREKFKEEEKAHLRKMRELRAAARRAQSMNATRSRVTGMVEGFQRVAGTHDEFMSKLDEETARAEARLEVALENQPPVESKQQDADALLAQLSAEVATEDAVPEPEEEPEAKKTIGLAPEDG